MSSEPLVVVSRNKEETFTSGRVAKKGVFLGFVTLFGFAVVMMLMKHGDNPHVRMLFSKDHEDHGMGPHGHGIETKGIMGSSIGRDHNGMKHFGGGHKDYHKEKLNGAIHDGDHHHHHDEDHHHNGYHHHLDGDNDNQYSGDHHDHDGDHHRDHEDHHHDHDKNSDLSFGMKMMAGKEHGKMRGYGKGSHFTKKMTEIEKMEHAKSMKEMKKTRKEMSSATKENTAEKKEIPIEEKDANIKEEEAALDMIPIVKMARMEDNGN